MDRDSTSKSSLRSGHVSVHSIQGGSTHEPDPQLQGAMPVYRVYRRRWLGVIGLSLLNIAAGMNWLWFSPVSTDVAKAFNMSLTKVNWLNNTVNIVYLPVAFLVPPVCARYGIRIPCITAAIIMIIGGWLRYAATAKSLSGNSAYALLFFAQFCTGLAQPWFQILAPKYSELWFDLKGRTTATALMSIANPFGSALGELISPLIDDVSDSVLVLAIITTVLGLCSFLILSRPPTPPTFAGSQHSPPMMEILRASIGKPRPDEHVMSSRQRIDFAIVTLLFSAFVGAADAFFILVDQIFSPHGYSSDASGNMGGALIIAGLIGAIVTAPLFDRVFTRHLALVAKVLVPILGVAWLSLIWDVRPHNYGGLYPVFIILGVGSFILLPVALELGCEVTHSPESSSAVLWCAANLLTFVFVIIMDALRAGDDARPPRNMKRALIFMGVFVLVSAGSVLGLDGKQVRRDKDKEKEEQRNEDIPMVR